MTNANRGSKDTSSGKKDVGQRTIALNKRARHDYALEDRYEAGLALQGWEVKALRAGRVAFADSYALIKDGEIFLFGAQITPLPTASTHVLTDVRRTRKLLLHDREIAKLIGAVERSGYTLIPTAMYWKSGRVKLEIALAKGKQSHDKRAAIKERDWGRDKQRIMRKHNKDA
jgi:SsrA-binding protein